MGEQLLEKTPKQSSAVPCQTESAFQRDANNLKNLFLVNVFTDDLNDRQRGRWRTGENGKQKICRQQSLKVLQALWIHLYFQGNSEHLQKLFKIRSWIHEDRGNTVLRVKKSNAQIWNWEYLPKLGTMEKKQINHKLSKELTMENTLWNSGIQLQIY